MRNPGWRCASGAQEGLGRAPGAHGAGSAQIRVHPRPGRRASRRTRARGAQESARCATGARPRVPGRECPVNRESRAHRVRDVGPGPGAHQVRDVGPGAGCATLGRAPGAQRWAGRRARTACGAMGRGRVAMAGAPARRDAGGIDDGGSDDRGPTPATLPRMAAGRTDLDLTGIRTRARPRQRGRPAPRARPAPARAPRR